MSALNKYTWVVIVVDLSWYSSEIACVIKWRFVDTTAWYNVDVV